MIIESSKDIGSRYMARYTTYIGLIKCINHMLCIYGFGTLFYTLSYVKEKVSIYIYIYIFILDITDPNTIYICIQGTSKLHILT